MLLNTLILALQWSIRTLNDEVVNEKSDIIFQRSCPDCILMIFPPLQLELMIRLINNEFERLNIEKRTNKGEMLTFFGILIFISKFEFRKRSSLLSSHESYKYVSLASLGRTRMSRHRFDTMLRCLWFWQTVSCVSSFHEFR